MKNNSERVLTQERVLGVLIVCTVVQRKKSSLGLQATQQHDLSTPTSKCHVV